MFLADSYLGSCYVLSMVFRHLAFITGITGMFLVGVCPGSGQQKGKSSSATAPYVVVPASKGKAFPVPADAGRGLVRAGKNEIRHYSGDRKSSPYIVSKDNGMTWSEAMAPTGYPPNYGGIPKESPAIVLNPYTKEYMRIQPVGGFVFTTKGGLDGKWLAAGKDGKWEGDWKDEAKRKNLVSLNGIMRNPLFINKGKRVIVPAHEKSSGTWLHISDDGGLTWHRSKNNIHAPRPQFKEPHKGVRWYNGGVEASIVELAGGRLWALVRTAHDQYFQSFSDDSGETWSQAEPSRFFGTLTMPTIGKLRDGRLIALWTNTMAMPELAHVQSDNWEDVFTNRDSHHIALSEDGGKTWFGFRELILDEHRNRDDYANYKGSEDRGKHQSEFLELDKNRILISVGQHAEHRRLMIVDLGWVYEKSRSCNFSNGLDDWTYHTYIPQVKGHHSYNRKPAAALVQHPDKFSIKAMQVKWLDDPSLVNEEKGVDYRKGGATWNFPNGESGELSFRFMIAPGAQASDSGIQVSLTDRLFNATDEYTKEYALYTFPIQFSPGKGLVLEGKNVASLEQKKWYSLTIKWKGTSRQGEDMADILLNNKPVGKIPLKNSSPNGASYIHLITTATGPEEGFLIDAVRARVK